MTLPSDFSSANLKVGRSLPASVVSGTLFMKLGSPPAAGVAEPSAASETMPAAAKNARRCGSDMVLSLCGPAKCSGAAHATPDGVAASTSWRWGVPITSRIARGQRDVEQDQASALQAATGYGHQINRLDRA